MLFNKSRAVELMQRFALDAIVAATRENVAYTSDFAPWGQAVHKYFQRPNFVVLPRHPDQTPTLLIYPGEATYLAAFPSWIEDIVIYGSSRSPHYKGLAPMSVEEQRFAAVLDEAKLKGKNAAEALAAVLREKGLALGAIGLDHEGMAPAVKEFLRGSLPQAKFFDASDLFRVIRMIKTSDEIERLRNAAALNESAIQAIFKMARVGCEEIELARAYYAEIGVGKGVVEWLHLGSGRRSAGICPPTAKKLAAGDILRTDAGCILDCYHADTCGTAVLGEPTGKQASLFAAGKNGIQACLEILSPGCKPSRLAAALSKGLRAAGVVEAERNFVGHTIGIEAREFPFEFGFPKPLFSLFLPETTDIALEENMVINIEVALVERGFGGIQIEHTLVICPQGYKPIIPQLRELVAIG
jgi:Xaa-Pro aminopeptidase